jgi:hypothetical protein
MKGLRRGTRCKVQEKYSWQGADGSRQKLEVRDQTSEVRGKADL